MQSFQVSRHELKYLVSESQASAVRSEIQAYLRPDKNTGSDENGYRVQSLYLDSRDSQCYNETLCGNKNRFKLRISCLLYTSPSPRDGLLSRMPSSA